MKNLIRISLTAAFAALMTASVPAFAQTCSTRQAMTTTYSSSYCIITAHDTDAQVTVYLRQENLQPQAFEVNNQNGSGQWTATNGDATVSIAGGTTVQIRGGGPFLSVRMVATGGPVSAVCVGNHNYPGATFPLNAGLPF